MRAIWLLIFIMTPLFSLPVGNPAEPASYGLEKGLCARYGFYGDYVFNRHLRRTSSGNDSDLDTVQLYTNAGYLVLNYCNRYDLFCTLGASSSFIFDNAETFWVSGTPRHSQPLRIFTDSGFSWSVGLRGCLFEYKCFVFGAEAQYFRTNMEIERMTFQGDNTNSPGNSDMKYHEWQFAAGVTWNLNELLQPYVAFDVAGVNVDFTNPSVAFGNTVLRLSDLNVQKHFGYAIGLALLFCENSSFSIEGRFSDEKGIYLNGQMRF